MPHIKTTYMAAVVHVFLSDLSVVKQSISGGVGYFLEQYKDLNMFPASHIYEHLVYLHLVYSLVPDLINLLNIMEVQMFLCI